MPLWDKVRQELDKAGIAARDLLDEGKLRIEAYRARSQADEAAAALGYAHFRARQGGAPLAPDDQERLHQALALRDGEARRLEQALEAARADAPAPSAPQPPQP